jgi:uncharacterized small protein (DUF1192 family)
MSNTLKLREVRGLSKDLSLDELQHQVWILTKRVSHLEVELAQARASRDSWRERYAELKRQAPTVTPGLEDSEKVE